MPVLLEGDVKECLHKENTKITIIRIHVCAVVCFHANQNLQKRPLINLDLLYFDNYHGDKHQTISEPSKSRSNMWEKTGMSSAAKDTWKKTEEKTMGQQNWRVWYGFTIQLLGCPLCQETAIGTEKRHAMPKHFFVCSYTRVYIYIHIHIMIYVI